MLNVIDSVAPIVTCELGPTKRKSNIPREILSKMNMRNSLLKKYKITGSVVTLERVRFLNKEISTHYSVAKEISSDHPKPKVVELISGKLSG